MLTLTCQFFLAILSTGSDDLNINSFLNKSILFVMLEMVKKFALRVVC